MRHRRGDNQMEKPNRSERVVVKVTPGELETWDNAAEEEQNCKSRSEFVRLSCTRQINGAIDRDSVKDVMPEVELDTTALVDAVEIAMSDVTERLEHLDDRLADVESEVRDSDEIDTLARQIFRELPYAESEDEMREQRSDAMLDTDNDEWVFPKNEDMRLLSTAEAWAEYFGIDVADARRALSRACTYFEADIEYFYHLNGERRFYRTTELESPDNE